MEIKPVYVTFEQAKWLKEKEFDEYCIMKYFLRKPSGYNINYNKETPYNINGYDGILLNEKYIDNSVFIYAPEQWQVVEWFLNEHDIWIEINLPLYHNFRFTIIDVNKKLLIKLSDSFYDTPQKAYSAAFDFVLNKLL